MNRISNAAFAAIAVACLTQIAAPIHAQDRAPVSGRVVYGDLDLTVPAGRATFAGRVRSVAARLCEADTRDLPTMQDARRCHGEMMESGRAQLARLVTRPQVQVGSRDAAIIVAAR